MKIGYKARVVVLCQSYEVEKLIQPIKSFSADVVIGFHNYFDDDPLADVRRRCADTFEKLLSEYKAGAEYHAFSVDLYDYSELSRKFESLIDFVSLCFDEPEIYINISSGTPEFASAATTSAHYHRNVHLFTVRGERPSIGSDLMLNLLADNGKICGMSRNVSEPELLLITPAEPPDRTLVESLRILAAHTVEGRSIMAKDMISLLKEKGLWYRAESSPNDNVYYLRDYIEKWIANEWIIKGAHRNTYVLTEKGKMILDTFYIEDESLRVLSG